MTPLATASAVSIAGRLAPTDLALKPGEMAAVIGPNGGGKTSLLRVLARTEDALGKLSIDGQNVDQAGEAQRRRLLAFLPATREASWPVSVSDYLQFGLAAPDPARIAALTEIFELTDLRARPIDRLSTGERARAMLGRAIAGKARLLLLDEPLSNLDPYWVLRTIDIIRSEIEANASAALVSVHDLSMLPRFDRVLLVSGGGVIADGSATEVLSSRLFAAAFRIQPGDGGWSITPLADPQSSR